MSEQAGRIDVLVVGRFPSADDPVAGRFIADQVAALRATGRVEPSVVAFENAALRGAPELRTRQEAAVIAATETACRSGSPFSSSSSDGPPGIPVARLAIAGGETPGVGADHRAAHRISAILPLVARPGLPGWRLVHGHVGYPEGVAAAAAAKRLAIPFVVTEHASNVDTFLADPVTRARYVAALAGAARVVAVSRVLAGEIESAIPAMRGRIVVIPNAVAIDDFPVAGPSGRAPAELLWIGRRTAPKGTGTLLRAFALVLAQRPDATLRLIGPPTGREDDGWQRLAAELGIASSVRFEGRADRAGVVAAMSRATCFVHPSVRETFGVVAAEALASGLPVVASDSGGVREILGEDPDAFGALVPAGDPAALAAGILRTLDRSASFDPWRLRAHVEARFGAAVVAGRIADLYDDVLAKASAGEPAAAAAGRSPEPVASGAPVRQASTPARPASPSPASPAKPAILVAFSRPELDRALATFPAWVTADLRIVTSGTLFARPDVVLAPPGTDVRLADLLGWGGSARQLDRLAGRARRTLETLAFGKLGGAVIGRLGRPGSTASTADRFLTTLTATIAAMLPAVDTEPALVFCLSGIDHLAAAPLIASGRLRPAPGGLRWLADLRAASSVPGSGAAASGAAGSGGAASGDQVWTSARDESEPAASSA